MVMVACFVALVTVLRRSDGNEQTRWLYKTISLNSLLALLNTL